MIFKPSILFLLAILLLYNRPTLAQDVPIPDWVKDIGGTGESKLAGIGVDKYDNIYVAGNFQGSLTVDHSGVSSPISLSSNGNYDIYIAKYTADGKLLWAKSIGGSSLDQVNNLAVDKDGNVIIGGSFSSNSIDCNPGAGSFFINSSGGEDALVVKLDTDGNFLWARSVGSGGTDRGHVVTTDKDGNVIFVGSFTASLAIGANSLINKGGFDGFLAKYSPTGAILWAAPFSSSADDEIKSVKTDSNNAIAVMGYFGANINLNPRGSAYNLTASSETYFIAKYTSNGMFEWANKIDGSSSRTVASISIGPANDIFTTGVFSGTINFNSSSPISLTALGARNLFIAKYNNNGQTQWAKAITATSSNPYSYYITVDNENNAYIGGFFDQTLTFNPGPSSKTLTYHGGRDTFFAKYNSSGNYQWAFNFGSSCTGNFGHKIDVDSKKNVLLGGAFCSTVDFNPSNCNLDLTAKHSTSDGYIAKFNQVKMSGEAPVITKFELAQQKEPAIIDIANRRITITVNSGTDLTKLKPIIETDLGILTPLSNTEADFSQPKTYKITTNCIDYFWVVMVNTQSTTTIKLCSGENTVINGDSNTPTSYQWEILTNNTWLNAPLNATQANYQTASFSNLTTNTIVISLRRKTLSLGVETYDSYTNLLVYPAIQNNSISTAQIKFCEKANLSISGSTATASTQSSFTYRWQKSLDNNNWTDVPNTNSKDFTPAEITTSTFFRRVAVTDNCSSYSNSIKIEIMIPPIVNIIGSLHGCASVSLTATGGVSYQWSGGSTPNQATNTFTTSGTYQLTVTNAEGCTTTVARNITVGIGPTNITGNTTDCAKVTLTASGGTSYQWNGGLTPNQATNTFTTSGTYQVTITDANGCTAIQQRTVTVVPNITPSLSITPSTTNICIGNSVSFTPNYANAGSNPSFKWLINGQQVSTSSSYHTNRLQNNDEVYCEIKSSDACGLPFLSNKIVMTVNPLPTLSFNGDMVIENDGPKVLTPNAGNDIVSYSWLPTLGLDNPNIKHPKANPATTTTYTLTVTNATGCVTQAAVKVIVLNEIFIPNVFSPNGDGKNDQWVIKNISDYVGTKVQIFNRYGQRVFQSDNFILPWEGTFNGQPLPLGNYYYILDLTNKSKKRYTGTVTILR